MQSVIMKRASRHERVNKAPAMPDNGAGTVPADVAPRLRLEFAAMSKFTPGPWHTEMVGDGPVAPAIADKDMNSLLTLVVEDDLVFAAVFNQGDAALMADAPALLDALADLLALAERWEESLDSHYNARSIEEIEADGDLADEIRQARALISKHRGEL